MSTITNPVDNSVERELPTQQDKVQNTENKKVQDAVQTVIAGPTPKKLSNNLKFKKRLLLIQKL